MIDKSFSIIIVAMLLIVFGVGIYLFKTHGKASQKQEEL
jgi:cbb3-type cytochrome oxidase subunit 3